MRRLMKLELQKMGLVKHILFSLLAIVFCMLFLTVSLVDSFFDPAQEKDTFESAFLLTGLLLSSVFLIGSAVMTASLVISEYNQRTILILFSYPLNKQLLIASKMLLIMLFTMAAMLAGYVCCCGYLVLADAWFDILESSFHLSYLAGWIPSALVSILVCGILTWLPFAIGMLRKSIPDTLVTAMITLVLRQILISQNAGYRENLSQVCLLAAGMGLLLGFIFRRKVTDPG